MTTPPPPTRFPQRPNKHSDPTEIAWLVWDMLQWFVTTKHDPLAATVAAGGGGGGGLTLIEDKLLVAPTASVTFSAIPQTFKHLKVIISVRSARVDTFDEMMLRFNGDAGGDYTYTNFQTIGAGAVFQNTQAVQTEMNIGEISGDTSVASSFAVQEVLIPDYTSTIKHQMALATSSDHKASSELITGVFGGHWSGSAAISSITLFAASANMMIGSRLSLYGF